MSIYYGVKIKKDTEFIVVQHTLRGFEGEIMGLKYRQGYAVVIKNSKTHRDLSKIKPKPNKKEFDITHLENLACVINPRQIQYIWGKAVYDYYKRVKFKTENPTDIRVQLEDMPKCVAKTKSGSDCMNKAITHSQYCKAHIQLDPRIKEDCEKLGIMPVKEKKFIINKLIEEKIKPQES
jgi:hypothetical protein